ncbi:MAG: aminomethyl-transferring glycine dehydrogenase [Actinomycetes bacterium]
MTSSHPTAPVQGSDAAPSLRALEQRDAFLGRHIGPDDVHAARMLGVLGLVDVDALLDEAVPDSIRDDTPLALPDPEPEHEVLARLRELAAENRSMRSFLGLGYHGTITPPVIRRNLLENPGWYTAYTPYQPEISQGRLEALLTFQTMVADLTGMELANASLLDEGTAAAEAVTMSRRTSRQSGSRFLVDADTHPQTLAVVATRAEPLGIEVDTFDPTTDEVADDVFGVLLQYPASSGAVRDDRELVATLKARGVLVTVAADPLALTLLTPPGEWGADIVVGTTQRFGVPMMFGGPHAAYIATSEAMKRTLPGRLVGVSVDTEGREAYRLALQTREQHIRREKATSNICTSQVLLAVTAAMYAVHHGPEGLTTIARRVHRLAGLLVAGLRDTGMEPTSATFFDTVTVRVPGRATDVVERAEELGYNLRLVDGDHVAVSFDETTSRADVAWVLSAFGVEDVPADEAAVDGLPAGLLRTSEFLTHPRFHRYRSETDLVRYLRKLADRDIALDRAMIPLGSCTMKLNAAAEMEAVTWPEFADVHPFVPAGQAQGYRRLIRELEQALVEITGYDAVSVQPNSGAQGELAGLLAIRGYHRANGDLERTVCLIPESAHGTNAASAVMAGMDVVVVKCDEDGNVDVAHLAGLVEEHGPRLAALMVTYPSTHGVFETTIGEICDLVHEHGGQVYLDGANLNALVGVAKPGHFGADVSHLNLHKTFCIPHGGGGPGVGPIGVRSHLAPFLPNHPLVEDAGPETGVGPVAAAPFGSPGVLPISWAYIRLMGSRGLRAATEAAILNANYLAARLAPHYPVLYTGATGRVAHECILDIRGIQRDTGVSNEDVAKRLIDYGFHAPTMSWPVPGTLMIEPTESESQAELDRFVDAMVAIRGEIDRIASGEWPADDNPLVNAPHPAEDLLGTEWSHPYTREEAAYPVASLRRDKYWPPVSRIDGAYGDRNLVCACPPVSDWA